MLYHCFAQRVVAKSSIISDSNDPTQIRRSPSWLNCLLHLAYQLMWCWFFMAFWHGCLQHDPRSPWFLRAKRLKPIHDQSSRRCFFNRRFWWVQIPKAFEAALICHIPETNINKFCLKENMLDKLIPEYSWSFLINMRLSSNRSPANMSQPRHRMELRSDSKDCAPRTTSIARLTTSTSGATQLLKLNFPLLAYAHLEVLPTASQTFYSFLHVISGQEH